MEKFPLVTIVTPAYRVEYFIKRFIENISKIDYPNFEVIIVVDPSLDKSVEIIRKQTKGKKNWHFVVNKKHLGISRSLNLGIKKSKGKYVVFFMTDMFVDKNCLREMIKYIEKTNESIGAVSAKTYDLHKRNIIQVYRMYFMPQTGFLYIPEYGLKDSPKYNKILEGFSGLDGTLFKREVFKTAGMFDVDINVGINDLDMIWRTWLAGFKIVRLPSAKIYHWSLKEGRDTVKWEFAYARMIGVFIQNYSMKYLLVYLPQLFFVYTFRGLVTLIQGNPNPIKGWLQACIWSLLYLPKALKKRKTIQNNVRVVSDEYLHDKIFGKLSLLEFYRYVKGLQKNITPVLLTKEGANEKILTYSK